MNKSESIGKLAEALSKAQTQIKGAVKDSTNPHFKSKYADLAAVWDACRDALTANGLSVAQTMDSLEDHTPVVETMLMHTSGEFITSRLAMRPSKMDPQGIGSAITYARRYALAAMVGVCPEDDDANAASQTSKPEVDQVAKRKLEGARDVNELQQIWGSLTVTERNSCQQVKDNMKAKLEALKAA